MKQLFFVLLFSAFLAFGQKAETFKLDRAEADQAWAAVTTMPTDTPAITSGGLVVEAEPNGAGRKVWLATSQPGQYLLRGTNCAGEIVKLGEVGLNEPPSAGGYVNTFILSIYDGRALTEALPFAVPICSLEVFRVDQGRIERAMAMVNPWTLGTKSVIQITGEGINPDGKYYLTVLPAPGVDIPMAILGRSGVAAGVQKLQTGTLILTFPDNGLTGLTTLTVCPSGQCFSVTFDKKITAGGGKG